ncbi:MAG: CoA transferase [Dehalococcoidia bacterium]|nr:CoA transferase [Dehalococcoidia bacterium]MDW8119701.1 CoA transferase [Chloroflexota bacterium]
MSDLPLQGMRVLDFTQVMAGPFCTLLLGDLGADVVKVERPPEGEENRRGAVRWRGESLPFLLINRNKRGICVDLKHPEGRKVALRLAQRADVVVENYRPGTMKDLGLDYEAVRRVKPDIIYCSISGFGQTGPYAYRGGYDLIAQGMSGLMSVTGTPEGPPVKVGVPVCDLVAGMYAAQSILAAYIYRQKTGQGQYLDVSLLESGIALTFWETAEYMATGRPPRPMGSAHRLSAPYQAFRGSDGKYFTIGAGNQANWRRLCQAIGRPDLLEDPRFADGAGRIRHLQALQQELERTFATRPVSHWLAVLDAAEVPCGPIYTLEEVYKDPHVQARQMLVEVEHPTAGPVPHIGVPVKFSLTPGRIRRPAPTLGQHTQEVLEEAGFSPQEIEALRQCKAVM